MCWTVLDDASTAWQETLRSFAMAARTMISWRIRCIVSTVKHLTRRSFNGARGNRLQRCSSVGMAHTIQVAQVRFHLFERSRWRRLHACAHARYPCDVYSGRCFCKI